MGLGIAAAVPIQIVATGPPAAAVIFTKYDNHALDFVLVFAVFVGSAKGQLPTHLGLGLDE